ncbi:MAG: RdgB/HAM1 family non-canonical purine NTP pyrophosphatase [Bacteroidetes bacterium]|nr:RdgB/HAM1 family non-canonical purine NTP pyrophosphatase [Bacteroidota bacterium]
MNDKPTLIVATNNAHKLLEIETLLGDYCSLRSLQDVGYTNDIPETGETLEENSLIKAETIFRKYKLNVLSDDSGLEVEILDGDPGVDTAIYAGEPRNDERNIDKLLKELDNQSVRNARFRTVLTLYFNNEVHQFEGIVEGIIASERRGSNGFGYDPIFIPENHKHTFAEMESSEKNKISHRSRALDKLMQFLKK